ncbi:hypothetical protein HDK64DRAFT_271642 [Phyllosticta capitalensis]
MAQHTRAVLRRVPFFISASCGVKAWDSGCAVGESQFPLPRFIRRCPSWNTLLVSPTTMRATSQPCTTTPLTIPQPSPHDMTRDI